MTDVDRRLDGITVTNVETTFTGRLRERDVVGAETIGAGRVFAAIVLVEAAAGSWVIGSDDDVLRTNSLRVTRMVIPDGDSAAQLMGVIRGSRAMPDWDSIPGGTSFHPEPAPVDPDVAAKHIQLVKEAVDAFDRGDTSGFDTKARDAAAGWPDVAPPRPGSLAELVQQADEAFGGPATPAAEDELEDDDDSYLPSVSAEGSEQVVRVGRVESGDAALRSFLSAPADR